MQSPGFFLFVQIVGLSLVHCYVNKSEGEVNIAVIFSNCNGTARIDQKLDASRWIVDRINFLSVFKTLKVGLAAYNACKSEDYVEALFDVWRKKATEHFLGVIAEDNVTDDVEGLSHALRLNLKRFHPDSTYLVRSTVSVLEALKWSDNVTAVIQDKKLVDELFQIARTRKICISKYWILRENSTYESLNEEGPLIIFADHYQITNFLSNNEHLLDGQMILIPTDGQTLDISENSYTILPSNLPLNDSREKVNLIPAQLIFELSQPILSYTELLRIFLKIHCNETKQELSCLQNKKLQFSTKDSLYTNEMILNILKIEPSRNNFLYDVYRVENESEEFFKMGYNFKQSLRKAFTYNLFDDHLVNLYDLPVGNSSSICVEDLKTCRQSCLNFREMKQGIHVFLYDPVEFRSEPFVLVFIAISAVGVLVNLIILTFLFICICRKEVLEGNPATTIFLLLTVLFMYCSVLPFAIKEHMDNANILCLLKSLWTTLSICGAFSLILSRCILLATVTKEIAYMSHIPGSVQSFMTLFIFGIQTALSLQVINDCQGVFSGSTFIYLMSYNILLLLMILCLGPMIFKSQRNYKEGKYFFISAVMIAMCWCFWISCYKVLNESWRDLLICFATVSTASVLQGIILVSRTYLMMVSSVRHKIRNSLPNLNERNGVLDIYRADARQVYDCVNVAALNAISVARAGITTTDLDDDIYNYPTLPRDEELNFEVQTNSSVQLDKVTRF
ncbi:protein bride of sevenless [Coccinella septempunctata]|uniref:protein bride of sevenless n=1 Tax=Coccinella septempunctata TaxID=41139 RepID=UPI001D070C46|nr:protein bride of sevenless [Coccinella septempunctata]